MYTNSIVYKFITSWISINDKLFEGSIFVKYVKKAISRWSNIWRSSSFGRLLGGFANESVIASSKSIKILGSPPAASLKFLTIFVGNAMKNAIQNSKVIALISKLRNVFSIDGSIVKNSYVINTLWDFWSHAD